MSKVVRFVMFVVVGVVGLSQGVRSLMNHAQEASGNWPEGQFGDAGTCNGSGATCGGCFVEPSDTKIS